MSQPDHDNSVDPRTRRMLQLTTRITRQLQAYLPEQWTGVELTMPQLRTMVLLASGPYRMSDIADHLGSSFSATTAMIDRLVEKDLVERVHSTTDRRVITCQLTELGHRELDAIWGMQTAGVQALAKVMTDHELDTVLHAMEIMADASSRIASTTPSDDETSSRSS